MSTTFAQSCQAFHLIDGHQCAVLYLPRCSAPFVPMELSTAFQRAARRPIVTCQPSGSHSPPLQPSLSVPSNIAAFIANLNEVRRSAANNTVMLLTSWSLLQSAHVSTNNCTHLPPEARNGALLGAPSISVCASLTLGSPASHNQARALCELSNKFERVHVHHAALLLAHLTFALRVFDVKSFSHLVTLRTLLSRTHSVCSFVRSFFVFLCT